jgi:hypothetical protein
MRVLWSGSRDPSIIHSRFLRFTSTTQPTVRSQNIRRKLSRVLMIKVSNYLSYRGGPLRMSVDIDI